ncbi:MAG: hypothetical protein AB7L17_23595 [Ilumatobacteraceae bacterium]
MRLRLKQGRIEVPPRGLLGQSPSPNLDEVTSAPSDFLASFARLWRVVDRLPSVPFTATQFADHAMGLSLLRHRAEVDPVIAHLTAVGVIEPCAHRGEPTWLPVRWTDGRQRVDTGDAAGRRVSA